MNQPSDCAAGVTRLTTRLARYTITPIVGFLGDSDSGDLGYFRERKEGRFAVYISGRPSRIISLASLADSAGDARRNESPWLGEYVKGAYHPFSTSSPDRRKYLPRIRECSEAVRVNSTRNLSGGQSSARYLCVYTSDGTSAINSRSRSLSPFLIFTRADSRCPRGLYRGDARSEYTIARVDRETIAKSRIHAR